MPNLWDQRYSEPGYAYGSEPNEYLKARLAGLEPGRILFPAEGEGRNAVYAALQGWQVTAFDQSPNGRIKAMELAAERGVNIEYLLGEFSDMHFVPGTFDAIALIYAHFPAEVKDAYHRKMETWLKPGGFIIFEAFSREHIPYREKNPAVGGPSEEGLLYTTDDIRAYFTGYRILELAALPVELHEGKYHNGTGHVVRGFIQKPAL